MGEVDAIFDEQGKRLGVLDALGDRLVAEILGEACNGLDEMLVGLVRGQVPDEVDVDLQVCQLECLEVREAREPGAEVVKRDAAADVGKSADELLRRSDVR